jgi:methylmalonyl-CoA/ethylmalonyl-CoA epimerase
MSSEIDLNIGQIGIPVTKTDRAVEFYELVLGLKLLFKAPPGLAFLQSGDIRLMLDASAKEHAGHGSVLYFNVNNIERWYGKKKESGVVFEREPHLVAKMPDHELWMCFLRDPDGNLIGIMEEKRDRT